MIIEDLYRVIDFTNVYIYDVKIRMYVWHGRAVNIPICYFDRVIKNICAKTINKQSVIVINVE